MIAEIYNRLKDSHLFKSFLITMTGSGLSKVIMIAGTFYCTNSLTKLEFGEYSFIRNTLTMILTICASNFSGLCTKFAAEASTSVKSVQRLLLLFLFSLSACLIVGVLLLLLPEIVLLHVMETTENVLFFRFAGMLLPLFMVQPLIEGVLRGLMHFKMIGWLQTSSSVFYVLTLILGIQIAGVEGAIWGLYLYCGIYAIISLCVLCKASSPFNKKVDVQKFWLEYRSIFRMILPVFILSFVEAPIFWYLQVLLTKYATAEAVGSMTVMKQVRNLALLIPNYFFMTYIAFAGRLNAKKKYKEYFSQFDKLIRYFILAGIGVAFVFSLLSKPILFLFGQEYVRDWLALVVCSAGIPISFAMVLIKQDLLLQEHQRELLIISVVWNVLWIVMFYAMVQAEVNSLMAFFYSELIAWLLNLAASYWLYYQDKKHLLYAQQAR